MRRLSLVPKAHGTVPGGAGPVVGQMTRDFAPPRLPKEVRPMSTAQIRSFVDNLWDQEIIPALIEFGRIPNKSVSFDPEWASHGHMQRAVDVLSKWAQRHATPGMMLEVAHIEGRTPL